MYMCICYEDDKGPSIRLGLGREVSEMFPLHPWLSFPWFLGMTY